MVLSQDELKLGERLILHLRGVHSSLPDFQPTAGDSADGSDADRPSVPAEESDS